MGFSTGLSAGYSHRLGNDFSVVLGGGINASIYTDSDYNMLWRQPIGGTALSPHWRIPGRRDGGQRKHEERRDWPELLQLRPPRQPAEGNFTTRTASTSAPSMNGATIPTHPQSDGTALMIDGSWNHAFDSSLTASLSAGYDRIKTEIDFNSYETYSGGFGLYKELPKGITVNLNGEVRLSEFDAMHPIAGVVREDSAIRARLPSPSATSTSGAMPLPSNTPTSTTTATSRSMSTTPTRSTSALTGVLWG